MASVTGSSISPFVRLVLYYAALVLVGTMIRQMWPDVYAMFAQGTSDGVSAGPALFGGVPAEPTGPLTDPLPAVSTALVIVGAFVVMLPVAWVYMITKRREGYDRSVVQTLIALPTAICGVVVIVQNSFALAFALAGIVAAVRFRNTLKDTKDAVYIFLAIGVGLAAGVQHVDVALMVSVLFNITILGLWGTNFGNVYAGPLSDAGSQATLSADRADMLAAGSERIQEHLKSTAGLAKGKRPNAVLTVHVSDSAAAQPMIETILEADTKVWDLIETRDEGDCEKALEYLVRKKKPVPTAALVDKLEGQCAPHVTGVEYRLLAGAE
jgi:hypothetical protein